MPRLDLFWQGDEENPVTGQGNSTSEAIADACRQLTQRELPENLKEQLRRMTERGEARP